MNYHSQMTSLGTKRGIRPYWNRYRRGKDKAEKCPFHSYCFNKTWGSTPAHHKRDLYANHCSVCQKREGYVRASHRGVPEKAGITSYGFYQDFDGYIRYKRQNARDKARQEVNRKKRNDPQDLAFAKRFDQDTSPYEIDDYDALFKELFLKNLEFLIRTLKEDAQFQLMKYRWIEQHGVEKLERVK